MDRRDERETREMAMLSADELGMIGMRQGLLRGKKLVKIAKSSEYVQASAVWSERADENRVHIELLVGRHRILADALFFFLQAIKEQIELLPYLSRT